MGVPPRKRTPLGEASEAPQRGLPWQPPNLSCGETQDAPAADARSPSLSSRNNGLESECVPGGTKLAPTPAATNDDPTTEKPSALKQVLTTLWAGRKLQQSDTDGCDEAQRGPLGLHLLHASPKPLVELIFVHGLRGGSIKTWRKGGDHSLFWPKAFLPTDPHVRDTNIYSFGYDSDWGSAKRGILDVHDFGNKLLEAMRTSPHLRNRTGTPIVLIGHSMGGLVVKKAYIRAREDKSDPEFAARIRCVFFLATPHRGSNYAALLNNVLKISGFLSPKPYLADLTTGSTSIQLINRDFCKYSGDLYIFSFFETLETSLGLASALIVEKTSAILGSEFGTERVQYIDANHRNICKFDGLDDPNYLIVRDSLSTAMDILLKKPDRRQLATLRSYLGVGGRAEPHHPRVEGSCRWIEHREDFKHWLAGGEANPGFYVVTAQPGAGKTALAAPGRSQTEKSGENTTGSFPSAGPPHEQSLAGLFRSIAYQMASTNTVFRNELLRLHNEGSTFAMDDARTIWFNLFKNGLFRIACTSPQYWIIDALDECPSYQELFKYLKGENPSFQLRVMVTSRALPAMPRLLKALDPDLAPIEIPLADTLKDICSYIRSRADALPVETQEERDSLSAKIQAKSQACFLWVRLVLDELENVYGFGSIMDILEGIPEGMIPYYQRATDLMQRKRKSEKRIAKAILRLVIAAARPLSTSELAQALDLESKDLKLQQNVKSAVEGLCSYLAQVDTNESVQLVHLTAREFLLSEDAKEFRVVKSAAQERLASTCLALLSAAELRPPGHPALLHQSRPAPSPLLDYAATWFSHHVYSSSPETDKLLLALDTFFKTNVQSWIEHVARNGDLHCLLKTSRNLRGYLDGRAKHEPSMTMPIKAIGDWSTDLMRLVPVFGNALVRSPTSVYFLVPPLAPTTSAIHTQFGKAPGGMSLVGYDNVAWDDCLASIAFDGESSATLSCGPNFIAVGMNSGDIILYNYQSFQKQRILNHDSRVEQLHSDRSGSLLISSNKERLTAWDQDGELRWEYKKPKRLILLDSSENTVVGFTRTGQFLKWDAHSGTLLEDKTYDYLMPGHNKDKAKSRGKIASLAAVSPGMDVLATAFIAHPVCLWLLKTNGFIGWAVDDRGDHPLKIMFNPNPQVSLLLVAYRSCELALFHSYSGTRVCSTVGNYLRQALLLDAAISPDGRAVAAVDSLGLLTIRDFETLNLLYYIPSPEVMSRTLRFTLDSSSLVDVTPSSMRVWSPPALNRKPNLGRSICNEPLEMPPVKPHREGGRDTELKAICAHPSLPFIITGNYGGEIMAYSSVTGKEVGLVYAHRKSRLSWISALALGMHNLVASGDALGDVVVHDMDTESPTSIEAGPLKFRARFSGVIRQLHFIPGAELLLVATAVCHKMFSLDGTCRGELKSDYRQRQFRWVFDHGGSEQRPRLFLIEGQVLKQFDIEGFPARARAGDIHLDYNPDKNVDHAAIMLATIHDNVLSVDIRGRKGWQDVCCLLLFDLDKMRETQAGGFRVTPLPVPSRLASEARRMVVPRPDLASYGQLLFLSDDNWLSGLSLDEQNAKTYTAQYFPVPNELVTRDGRDEVLPVRTIDDDIVFPLRDKLAVVKNGLKHGHVGEL